MKHDIHTVLTNTRPTLSSSERAELWKDIEAEISSMPLPSPYRRWIPLTFFHTPAMRALLLLALLIGGGATTTFAEQARPGDLLFPLDQAFERIELKLARTPEKRAAIGARQADERLTELKELMQETPTPVPVADDPRTDIHVSGAVDALLRVMEESNMNEVARERVYTNLFNEIDPLLIDVRVNNTPTTTSVKNKIEVIRDEQGETRIEIRETGKRTRIEKKEGKVRIEYEHSIESTVKSDVRIRTNDKKDKD